MSYFREVTLSTSGAQKPLFFHRLSNGVTTNMAVDGSGTAVIFKVSPPVGEVWRIASWSLYIEDAGSFDPEKWGNGITLTNGITPKLSLNGTATNLLDFSLLNTGDLSSICDGLQHLNFGTGNEIVTAEWDFIKRGQYIRLTDVDELQLVVQDNLTGLVNQYSTIKGYIE